MHVALISTYELGHQPIAVAQAARALAEAGHTTRVLDLSVDSWSESVLEGADAAAFSAPMHTGLRLGLTALDRAKATHPDIPTAAFGLYAHVAPSGSFDRLIAGEFEPGLVAWLDDLTTTGPTIHLDRDVALLPDRSQLPRLDRYAHLLTDAGPRVVGAVEASRGCAHKCRHCPLPTVYDGRVRPIDHDTVMADIDQVVRAGATHVTFADPDFFNVPRHAERIITDLADRWPTITYDATIKVEHLVRHDSMIETLRDTGCVFVVSAFESLDDAILSILDKGHTRAEAVDVVHRTRSAGLDLRPTWLPFTPWTTSADLLDTFRFIADHGLVGATDPIQLSIRLLVPAGSLLADHPDFLPHRGTYDESALGWTWTSPDPRLDDLAAELSLLVERSAADEPVDTFQRMWATVLDHAGEDPALANALPAGATTGRPRLTEPWFC